MVLFPLHSPVLKPDFNLSFRETERVRDLHPAPARQVPVVVELLLELQNLLARISRPGALWLSSGVIWIHCVRKYKNTYRIYMYKVSIFWSNQTNIIY